MTFTQVGPFAEEVADFLGAARAAEDRVPTRADARPRHRLTTAVVPGA